MTARSSIVALVFAGLFSLTPVAMPSAQEAVQASSGDAFVPARGGWQTYVNGRYGTRFDFPAAIFTPEAPPENGDGRSFASADAKLELYSLHNLDRESAAALRKRILGSDGYTDVTYSPRGRDWLVFSGFRGEKIFYEKYFVRNGIISGFGMEFPKTHKPFYAPMIERMENSFRAGHSD